MTMRSRKVDSNWRTVALCACAMSALTFLGWAPIDPDTSNEQNKSSIGLPDEDLLIGEVMGAIGSSPGDKPFQPSELDWLALRANAELRVEKWEEYGFSISYVSEGRGSDMIKVLVVYDAKRDNRDKINKEVAFVKKMLHQTAQQHGFEKWLKTKVEFVSVGG